MTRMAFVLLCSFVPFLVGACATAGHDVADFGGSHHQPPAGSALYVEHVYQDPDTACVPWSIT